jgi:hypothetical protein
VKETVSVCRNAHAVGLLHSQRYDGFQYASADYRKHYGYSCYANPDVDAVITYRLWDGIASSTVERDGN